MYKVIVTEQKPLISSIYCGIEIKTVKGNSLIFRNMYFVCNLKKRVIQYPMWLNTEQNFKQQIIELGYKF